MRDSTRNGHAPASCTRAKQLAREFLEQLAAKGDPNADAAKFERLSHLAQGDSHGAGGLARVNFIGLR
jgi:hypothetical protein